MRAMNPQVMNKLKQNIQTSELDPIFADEVLIMRNIKIQKTGKGKVEKEGHVALLFVDMMNTRPVGKFILSVSTANQLQAILAKEIEGIKKDLKNKTMPKAAKAEVESTGYVG